jgi:hypothetical protein
MTLVEDKRVASEADAEIAYQKTKELLKKYPNLKESWARPPLTPRARPARSTNSGSPGKSLPFPWRCLLRCATILRMARCNPLHSGSGDIR